MTLTDYARFRNHRLRELLDHARRTETDLQARLDSRLDTHEMRAAHDAVRADPVARRLVFLLAKARGRRQALERELAMRSARESHACRDGQGAASTGAPKNGAPAHGKTSVTAHRVPSVVT